MPVGGGAPEGTDVEETVERKFADLTIRIRRDQCIGSSNCVKLAREVFELDSENIVTFSVDAPAVERARLIEACSVCPVEALVVLDAAGKQLVP